jgi:hypothetical protein
MGELPGRYREEAGGMRTVGSGRAAERRAGHEAVSTTLARYSDQAIGELLAAARRLGAGIGGTSALAEVGGVPVFVKRLPLTDLERQPGAELSTANLFRMPGFCHYNIGAPGFGSWRELAVQTMTTEWVLAGAFEGFPLMYHWRVLPDAIPLPGELADVERVVAFWDGNPQVRSRIEALGRSSASIALFLEYVPRNLHQWLNQQVAAGDEAADRACAMVERELAAGTSFMRDRGLLHFDIHFENVLTDGERLYFADYGLALSADFELDKQEAGFHQRHQGYDRCYALSYLVNWLLTAYGGYGRDAREARIRAYARGEFPRGFPDGAADVLARHAPLAAVMTDFLRRLQFESRHVPYPREELRRLGAPFGA